MRSLILAIIFFIAFLYNVYEWVILKKKGKKIYKTLFYLGLSVMCAEEYFAILS